MNITDEMVERAANAIHYATQKDAAWPAPSSKRRVARAALDAALGDVEPLEDVLDTTRLTEMHVAKLVTGTWQTMLTVEGVEWGADDQPTGFGKTPGASIRAAVANATKGDDA